MKKKDVFVTTIKGLITGISLWISNISIASMLFSASSYNNVVNGFSSINKKNKELWYVAIPFIIAICFGLLAGFHLIDYFINKFQFQTIMLFIGFFIGGIVVVLKNNKIHFSKHNLFIPLIVVTLSLLFITFLSDDVLIIKNKLLQSSLIGLISGISVLIPSFSYLTHNISGKYEVVLNSLKHFNSFNDFLVIFLFVVVFIISLLLISRIIKKLLLINKNNLYLFIASLVLVNVIILILTIKPFTINFVTIFTSILAFLWGYIFAKNVEKE